MSNTATLIVCAYRSVSLPTHKCITRLLTTPGTNVWREQIGGEAGINRARSIQTSHWFRDTTEDVFLMVDDDITFDVEDANSIVDRCRNGYDVIAGAYPTGDASHLAVRTLSDTAQALQFAGDAPPKEMRHVATGFFAVHRRVIEAMIETLPLCNSNTSWAFWPFFGFAVENDPQAGGFNNLSEDYYFPVIPETPVLGSDWRWRPLSDYRPGDQVMSVDEQSPLHSSRRYKTATVERTIERRLPLWRIVTDEHEFITTAEHPWLSMRKWRHAAGRPAGSSAHVGPPNKWRWAPTSTIQVGDVLSGVVPQVQSPSEDPDYMAGYVQGIFHSDGTLSRDGRRGMLRMADIEAIDRTAAYLVALSIRATRMPNVWKTASPDHRQLYGLGIFERAAAEKLGQLMDYEPIPSESFARGYLAGMYDGDGTHNGGQVLVCNTSDVLKSRVVEAGHMLGLNFEVRPKWAYVTGHEAMHRFWMATCPAIQRKMTPIGQRGNDGLVRGREVKHRPVAVRSVESLGRQGDVACLATSSGTFIADGIASHNCNRARALGCKVWLDMSIAIGHDVLARFNVVNMAEVYRALRYNGEAVPNGALIG